MYYLFKDIFCDYYNLQSIILTNVQIIIKKKKKTNNKRYWLDNLYTL